MALPVSPEVTLISAAAELLRNGGLAAFLSLSMYVNYRLWHTKDALYDRLIESETKRANSAEDSVTKVVTEQTKTRIVLERLMVMKNGSNGSSTTPELPGS